MGLNSNNSVAVGYLPWFSSFLVSFDHPAFFQSRTVLLNVLVDSFKDRCDILMVDCVNAFLAVFRDIHVAALPQASQVMRYSALFKFERLADLRDGSWFLV
jgi:hypothetical protein